MKSEQFTKALPLWNDIKDLDRELDQLNQLKGGTTTLLSVVFDMRCPFQLRGLDEIFTQTLIKLIKDHLISNKKKLVEEFKTL